MVTQPLLHALGGPKRVLLAGCGGGYDILGAVPVWVELTAAGHDVHLASLSFCSLARLSNSGRSPTIPNLYEVRSSAATKDAYCPEAWLARWFEERAGATRPIWCFEKTGVRPLQAAYRHLVEILHLDAVVLVDGGVDSLLRGDESSLGTPEEDLASLAAVHELSGPTTFLACVGLGAELRDGICHAQVLERIAELTRAGAYLGTGALVSGMPAGASYREALAYVLENQGEQRQSHIHGVIAAAMDGQSGAQGPHVWLSPLLPLYWWFSLPEVARTHLFLPALRDTDEIFEVTARIEGLRKGIRVRERSVIPL
jgi:hypothetical protein